MFSVRAARKETACTLLHAPEPWNRTAHSPTFPLKVFTAFAKQAKTAVHTPFRGMRGVLHGSPQERGILSIFYRSRDSTPRQAFLFAGRALVQALGTSINHRVQHPGNTALLLCRYVFYWRVLALAKAKYLATRLAVPSSSAKMMRSSNQLENVPLVAGSCGVKCCTHGNTSNSCSSSSSSS